MSLAKKIALQDGETIELTVKQHWIRVVFKYCVAAVLLGLVSFFSLWLLRQDWWGRILFYTGLILGVALLVRVWLMHSANVLVITSERVLRIRRRGFLDEMITSLYFDELFDTTVRRSGIGARLFRYGTVVLRAESSERALDMTYVADPQGIERIILDQRDLKRSSSPGEVSPKAVYGLFLSRLSELSLAELEAASEAIERELRELEDASPES